MMKCRLYFTGFVIVLLMATNECFPVLVAPPAKSVVLSVPKVVQDTKEGCARACALMAIKCFYPNMGDEKLAKQEIPEGAYNMEYAGEPASKKNLIAGIATLSNNHVTAVRMGKGKIGPDTWLEALRDELRNGHPIIVLIPTVGNLPWWNPGEKRGHYVVVRGITGEGNILCNDPAAGSAFFSKSLSGETVASKEAFQKAWGTASKDAGAWIGIVASKSADTVPLAELKLDLGNSVTMKLVLIPAGKFMMGFSGEKGNNSRNDCPQHEVAISRPFYMGVYAVTQEQWKVIMGTTIAQQRAKAIRVNKDWPLGGEGDDHPMYYVSWFEAVEFCKKLSQKTGKTVGLPTEAQWEYACRAGSKTRFSYGDDVDYEKLGDYSWYAKNGDGKTHPVGQKKPNEWGLYDMHGNVLQWCADWYAGKYYESANKTDPQGPGSGSERVERGGCWTYSRDRCCSTYRSRIAPDDRGIGEIGFRVVVDLK